MAKEISRTFDVHTGAIFTHLEDSLGRVIPVTHYVLQPDGTPNDVEKAIADAHKMVDEHAEKIRAALEANGWKSDKQEPTNSHS